MTKIEQETFDAYEKRIRELNPMIKAIWNERRRLVKAFQSSIAILGDQAIKYENEVSDLAWEQWKLEGFRDADS